MFYSSGTQIPETIRLLEQAIERDPSYGPALSLAALCCIRLTSAGWSEDPEADNRRGAEFDRRALQAAGDDPAVLASSAVVLAMLGEDIGIMMVLIDRALALNPSFARGWFQSGRIRLMAGQADLAIEHIEASLRLSPRARVGFPFSVIGHAHFVSRRYDKAVPNLLLAIQDDPSFPPAYQTLAACYAHMGRIEEAREIVRQLRAITPMVVRSATHWRNSEHRELFLSGLRLAAGEAE
jgi:pentatricopeptide repeat protein